MINIFGLRIVTGKDWGELQKQVKTIADKQHELKCDHIRLTVDHYHTNVNVRDFMDFVMHRMPLKRHRKEARGYFPKNTSNV